MCHMTGLQGSSLKYTTCLPLSCHCCSCGWFLLLTVAGGCGDWEACLTTRVATLVSLPGTGVCYSPWLNCSPRGRWRSEAHPGNGINIVICSEEITADNMKLCWAFTCLTFLYQTVRLSDMNPRLTRFVFV